MPRRTLLLVISLGFAAWLHAQIQTGRLSGVVYDPNRAVVPAATITVTNKGTSAIQKVFTNETGVYVVPALNPGVYDVTITAAGFKTIARHNIEMEVGKDLL